jgi:ankyrin repeat protein
VLGHLKTSNIDALKKLREAHPSMLAVRDENDATVLHWCAWGGCVDLALEYLAVYPGQIDARSKNGQTALMWAAMRDHSATSLVMLRLLLAAGAAVDAVDANHSSALIQAAQNYNRIAVLLLVIKGAKVNVADSRGCTALHWASYIGASDLVLFLMAQGSNVNTLDLDGLTPLMRAIQKDQSKTALLLLEASPLSRKSDTYIKNPQGLDAAQLADSLERTAIKKMIEDTRKPKNFVQKYPASPQLFYLFGGLLCFSMWLFYMLPLTYEVYPKINKSLVFLLFSFLIAYYYSWKSDPGRAATHQAMSALRTAIESGTAVCI